MFVRSMRVLWYLVRLGRPHFAGGGVLFYLLGVAVAAYEGVSLRLPVLGWGLAAVLGTQFMNHYSNDYFDLAVDRANLTPTTWSGGSRILSQGKLPRWVALATALACAGVALVAAFWLAWGLHTGPWTLPLLLGALLLAWSYHAPPLALYRRGLGELAVLLLIPIGVPLVGYYLQTGSASRLLWWTVAPLIGLQWAMILSVEFSDVAADAAIGKRTLTVLLGVQRGAWLHNLGLAAAYAVLPLVAWAGLPCPIVGAAALLLPVAAWQFWRLARGDAARREQWGSLAFVSIALLVATTALELAALLWMIGQTG